MCALRFALLLMIMVVVPATSLRESTLDSLADSDAESHPPAALFSAEPGWWRRHRVPQPSVLATDASKNMRAPRAHWQAGAEAAAHGRRLSPNSKPPAALMTVPATATAQVERVADFDGGGDDASCSGNCTMACHCASLHAALLAAADFDTVWIVPPSDGSAIACEPGLWTNKSLRIAPAPWASQPVVFDCAGRSRAIRFDASGNQDVALVTLERVTIQNGVEAESVGGCLLASNAALELRHVVLRNCRAHYGGCALVEFFNADLHHDLGVHIHDSQFLHCNAFQGRTIGGGIYLLFDADVQRVSVVVQRCDFADSSAGYGGALAVIFKGASPETALTVDACTFRRLTAHWPAGGSGGAIVVQHAGVASGLLVGVTRCSFEHVRTAANGGMLSVMFAPDGTGDNTSIAIADCNVTHASAGESGGAVHVWYLSSAVRASVSVENSTFVSPSAGKFGGTLYTVSVGDASGSEVTLVNCTVADARARFVGGALHLTAAVARPATVNVLVSGCVFRNCSAGLGAGTLYAALSRVQTPMPPNYCPGGTTLINERQWQSSSTLTVEDTRIDNSSCTGAFCGGGVLSMGDGMLLFRRTNVTNAKAWVAGFLITSASASAFIESATVQGVEAGTNGLVRHGGTGVLAVTNSSFAPVVQELHTEGVVYAGAASAQPLFAEGSTLSCAPGETFEDRSRGQYLSDERWKAYAICRVPDVDDLIVSFRSFDMQWVCVPCPAGTYFLAEARKRDDEVFAGRCRPCPFGATCLGRDMVQANPGMWTTVVHGGNHPLLAREDALPAALVRCADGYCCRGASCLRYDSCARTRVGMLCGDCEAGSVAVLGSPTCRPARLCGASTLDRLFWPCTCLLLLGFAVWQVRTSHHVLECDPSQRRGVASALMKTTAAYFQSFPMLLLGDSATGTAAGAFLSSVSQLFSLRFATGSSGEGVCILPGMTPVGLEVVNVVTVAVLLFVCLPAVWLVHTVVGWFGASWLRLLPPRSEVYASALTSLVMLTYSVLTSAMVKLVTCVEVPEHGWRLLIQGELRCWSSEAWWQWLVAAWGLLNTLFVPAAIVVGGLLLRRRGISAASFWVSLVLPLPCIVAWCAKYYVPRGRLRWTRSKSGFGDESEEGPSVPPTAAAAAPLPSVPQGSPTAGTVASSTSRSTSAPLQSICAGYRSDVWWWDATLLLRRLVLSLLPMLLNQYPDVQAVMALILMQGFLLAHLHWRPMVSAATNILETGYLCSLVLVAALSIRTGTLVAVSVPDAAGWRRHAVAGATLLLLAVPPLLILYPSTNLKSAARAVLGAAAAAVRRCRLRRTVIRSSRSSRSVEVFVFTSADSLRLDAEERRASLLSNTGT